MRAELIFAQSVEDSPFFDTPLGMVLVWGLFLLGSIAVIAAGVAGVKSLTKVWRDGRDDRAENYRQDKLLDQVLAKEGWPNGADNIVQSHRDIYNKVAKVADNQKAIGEKVDRIELAVSELSRSVEQALIDRD